MMMIMVIETTKKKQWKSNLSKQIRYGNFFSLLLKCLDVRKQQQQGFFFITYPKKKNHQNFLRFIIYDKWWLKIWQKSIRKRPSFSMIMMMANNNNKNNKKEMCFLAIDQTNKQKKFSPISWSIHTLFWLFENISKIREWSFEINHNRINIIWSNIHHIRIKCAIIKKRINKKRQPKKKHLFGYK